MLTLTPEVAALIAATKTYPILLVDHSITGTGMHHSTRTTVTLDTGAVYVPGECDVKSIDSWETCVIRLRNTDGSHTAALMNSGWRRSQVTIRAAYPLQGGYVAPGYVDDGYTLGTSVVVVDLFQGVASSCVGVSPWADITCKRVQSSFLYVPMVRFSPQVGAFNRLPATGTVVVWGTSNETYQLQPGTGTS